jgi:hypothetical protein
MAGAALLAAAAACSTGPQSRVAVTYFDARTLPRDLLTVTVTDAGRTRTLRGADVGAGGREGRVLDTRSSGTMRVAFRFASGGTVAAEGSAEVPLRADWAYGFDVHVDSLDPRRSCFGCIGSRAFPLAAAYRRSPRDSVWLVWGGNSIRNPVVY